MKVKKSIVVARPDDSTKLVVIGEDETREFQETHSLETLLKAYAFIYKLICKELYNDQAFNCCFCSQDQTMEQFAGMVVTDNGLLAACNACDIKLAETKNDTPN
jgi:hypothetical protein